MLKINEPTGQRDTVIGKTDNPTARAVAGLGVISRRFLHQADRETMQRKLRIFILDDDADFRADLGEFLSLADYHVSSAGDARAVQMEDLCDCDVLILDLSMPGYDGATVLRNLSGCPHPPEVLVISGTDEAVIEAVADAGRMRHLTIRGSLRKPFDPDDLLKLLAAALPPDEERNGLPDLTDGAIAAALRNALDAATAAVPFPVTFQPQVRATDLSFAGAEALLANELPAIGPVAPERIVAAANTDPALADALMRETLRSALAGCRCWTERGFNGQVSVNVPITALRGKDAAAQFAAIVRTAGLTPPLVVCELTEDAVYGSSSDPLIAIVQLRLEGFGIALDDVGQRNSGLLQVSKLPITEMKIDRELIEQSRLSEKARSIVASLASLGRTLSLEVVAEGVETEQDLAFVRANHIDRVQGYLVSRKLTLPALLDWLETRQTPQPVPL